MPKTKKKGPPTGGPFTVKETKRFLSTYLPKAAVPDLEELVSGLNALWRNSGNRHGALFLKGLEQDQSQKKLERKLLKIAKLANGLCEQLGIEEHGEIKSTEAVQRTYAQLVSLYGLGSRDWKNRDTPGRARPDGRNKWDIGSEVKKLLANDPANPSKHLLHRLHDGARWINALRVIARYGYQDVRAGRNPFRTPQNIALPHDIVPMTRWLSGQLHSLYSRHISKAAGYTRKHGAKDASGPRVEFVSWALKKLGVTRSTQTIVDDYTRRPIK